VQLTDPKLPAPLVVKVPTVPVGMGLAGVTVIVQVDADPTVTGLLQTTVVVLAVNANAGRRDTARVRTAKTIASDTAAEPALIRISSPYFSTELTGKGCSALRYKLSDIRVYSA
jgi:hypothetical protein